MNNDEKKAHIEGINKSLKCLMDAGYWEDHRKIIMEGIVKLAERIGEERKVRLAEFSKKNDSYGEGEEWKKEIDDLIDLFNRKGNDENEFA